MSDVKTVVVHSGGMDSSICLALAIKEFGVERVHSLTFSYQQRHAPEIIQAKKICADWGVHHTVMDLSVLQAITTNALMDKSQPIIHEANQAPNTLVMGRNGLMAWLAAIYAHRQGADSIYLGVMELEAANSGYRDCSRKYMDLLENILRIDLNNLHFEIRTPLVSLLKKETMQLAHQMGVLEYLFRETITCYEGIPLWGCQQCPACRLRNEGIKQFMQETPNFRLDIAPDDSTCT